VGAAGGAKAACHSDVAGSEDAQRVQETKLVKLRVPQATSP
jgi:hypothetical protein